MQSKNCLLAMQSKIDCNLHEGCVGCPIAEFTKNCTIPLVCEEDCKSCVLNLDFASAGLSSIIFELKELTNSSCEDLEDSYCLQTELKRYISQLELIQAKIEYMERMKDTN